ncbi:MAG TPA: PAS domain-containing sensor histidine kinase [Ktedonobacteraceae bacterium]|nr:PAS domain-containing sensor histidine kinase [Ktedonobacteraceae bacterium]
MSSESNEHQFSEAHYQLAMKAAGLGVWYWDLLQGQQVWSSECKAILGVPQETEAHYETFLALVHPEDRRTIRTLLDESHRKKTPYSTEYRITWPDGSLHWIADRGSYFYNNKGKAIRLVGVVWDITLQKQVEETRAELERRKDEFIALASHELRTPLTSLKGNLQLAERFLRHYQNNDTPIASEKDQMAFDHLVTWNERALRQANVECRLVNDLLEANALQAGWLRVSLKHRNLSHLVRNAVDDLQVLTKSQQLHLDLPPVAMIPVMADEVRIGQVVTNYVENALRDSGEQQPVVVGITLGNNEVRVWVRDTGPGISLEEQRSLWERFRRIQSFVGCSGGLGLGLYICQELIRLHGGHTGVESVVGQGSTFWFTLPLYAEHLPEQTEGVQLDKYSSMNRS